MKTNTNVLKAIPLLAILVSSVLAFPPAPHHLIKGTVRDQMGYPIEVEGTVVMKTVSGVVLEAPLTPGLLADASYRLEVPMDAGVTSDAYMPTALNPLVPFTMELRIGSQTYLPFEMSGDFTSLGEAGGTTVIDLTLGVDSDGDGIPDLWEEALIARTRLYETLEDVDPSGDLDGDGLTNYEEYLAHTYAYDVYEGMDLRIKTATEDAYIIEFLGVTDHHYTIFRSDDVVTWSPQAFQLTSEATSSAMRSGFVATEVKVIEVRIPREPASTGQTYFKLFVD